MDVGLGELISGGGVLAFASVVWWELRQLRELIAEHLRDVGHTQRQLLGTLEVLRDRYGILATTYTENTPRVETRRT